MAKNDGVLVIGTAIDNERFERQLRTLERRAEKKELEIKFQTEGIEKTKRDLEDLKKEYANVMEQLDLHFKEFQEMHRLEFLKDTDLEHFTEKQGAILDALHYKYADLEEDLLSKQLELETEQDKLNAKLTEQQEKLLDSNVTLENIYSKINEINHVISTKPIEQINKALTKTINKVAKWALAVFGVRSAYMFVRNAMSTLTEYDEQLKADITYIKTALAYSVEPIVRDIVNLAKLLVQYLGYIIKAWSGRDIFASASKSLASANKSAKDLNKSLYGFDKINKLSSSDSGSGGGTSTSIKPLEEGKEPGWLKWIGDNGDKVATILMSIAAGLVAIKLGGDLLMGSAVAVAVYEIVNAVKDLIEFFKDPTWEKFNQIIIDIGIAVMALGVIFNSLPLIVGGAIAIIIALIAMFWDDIEEGLTDLQNSIYNIGEKITNWLEEKLGFFGIYLSMFVNDIVGVVDGIVGAIKYTFSSMFGTIKSTITGIIQIFKGDLKGGLTTIFKGIANGFITTINTMSNVLNVVVSPIRSLIVALGKVTGKNWTMSNIKIPMIPKLERGGIVHNPGAGVMMGNYVAGEGRSPEAVIPLDDATLDRLGQAIAKHSQINATIVNEMDGRVLSKNLAKLNNESSFARNGGY